MTKRILTVHKDNAEGTLQIDYLTGSIITPLVDKPDWAQGLATAIPQERVTFYTQRLGDKSAELEQVLAADTVNFEDLCWLGEDADKQVAELPASTEYRMAIVGKLHGINPETGAVEGKTLERDLAMENSRRTPAEQAALDEATHAGFKEADQRARKTAGQ